MLDHSKGPFCPVSSLQHHTPRKEARKPANVSWRFPEIASELRPTRCSSWDNAGGFATKNMRHQVKYIPSSTKQTNEKWNKNYCKVVSISWKLVFYLRNPEWSERVFQIWRKTCSQTFKKYSASVSYVSGGNQKLYSQSEIMPEISWQRRNVQRRTPLSQLSSERSSTFTKCPSLSGPNRETKPKSKEPLSDYDLCRHQSFSLYRGPPSCH